MIENEEIESYRLFLTTGELMRGSSRGYFFGYTLAVCIAQISSPPLKATPRLRATSSASVRKR